MRRILFALALSALPVLPAAASADRLLYTKDHNVWLADLDIRS